MVIPRTLPPVIERELRLAARRSKTYWGRVGAAAVGLGIFLSVMTAQLAIAPPASAGRVTFLVLAGLAAILVAGTVLRLCAESFAREKRENTLGLLFLTPLTVVDLVSGQLVASTLGAFYQSIALIPLLALPVLVGGVTLENFLLLVVSLGNLAFFAATIGLHASAGAWDEKRSTTQATVRMAGISMVLPILLMVLSEAWRWPSVLPYVLAISPAFTVWQATVSGAASSPAFWVSLALTQGMGWFFFRSACLKLRECWRMPQPLEPSATFSSSLDRPEAIELTPVETKPPLQFQPSSPPDRGTRRPAGGRFPGLDRQLLLNRNPVLWLAQRWRSQSPVGWIIGAAGPAFAFTFGFFGSPSWLLQPGVVLFTAFSLNAGVKQHVAAQAALALARDRAEDTLELLLSTPITPAQLVKGHLQTILQSIRGRLIPIAIAEGLWMALALAVHPNSESNWVSAAFLAGLLVVLVPDVRAVAWEALWQGVVSKDFSRARHRAVFKVLLLPWIPPVAITVGSAWVYFDSRLLALLQATSFVAASLVVDLVFTRRARTRLHERLPDWARRRANPGG